MLPAKRKLYRDPVAVAIVIGSAAFAFLLTIKLPFTPIYLENDSLIFLSDAQRMAAGEVMYRDFFQFTFPGVQTLYRVLFEIAGQSYWLLPAVIIAVAFATAAMMTSLAGSLVRDRMATFAPALIFIFFGFRYYELEGTHRIISPLIVLVILWLLLSRERTPAVIAAAGSLCGITSFFTQQRGVAVIIGIVIWLALEAIVTRSSCSKLAGKIAVLLAAFTGMLAAAMMYFVVSAGPSAFWSATVVYPWLYYGAAEQNTSPVLLTDIANAFSETSPQSIVAALAASLYGIVVPIAAFACSAMVLSRAVRNWQAWRSHALIALIWLCLLLSTAGPSPIRLYQISGPALILIFATVWSGKLSRSQTILSWAASIALVLLAASQVWRTQAYWQYSVLDTPTGTIAFQAGPLAERYQWLLANTSPGDKLYEARQPYAYFPLQLRNPTPISQVWESDYTRPEQVDQVTAGLETAKPKYVLWETPYDKPPEQRAPGDHLAPLYEYLQQHYQKVPDAAWSIEHGSQIEVWESVH